MITPQKIELTKHLEDLSHALNNNTHIARYFLIDLLTDLRRHLLELRNIYSGPENNRNFAVGVSLRGVLDYINLKEITSQKDWELNTSTLDLVWTRMWDSRCRLSSYPKAIEGTTVKIVDEFLTNLHVFYYTNFGHGVYLSPDIVVKVRTCSICNDNIKKCDHVPGELYSGVLCRQIFADMESRGVSLVSNPEDPRCRIWPWNCDDETQIFRAPALVSFFIDDFLQEDPWPHPDIVWPEGVTRSSPIGS